MAEKKKKQKSQKQLKGEVNALQNELSKASDVRQVEIYEALSWAFLELSYLKKKAIAQKAARQAKKAFSVAVPTPVSKPASSSLVLVVPLPVLDGTPYQWLGHNGMFVDGTELDTVVTTPYAAYAAFLSHREFVGSIGGYAYEYPASAA